MLRVLEDQAEQLVPAGLHSTLGYVLDDLDALGRKGLSGSGGESAPGIEFTVGPVGVGRTNVPASEDLVGAGGVWPLREERLGRVGELAVADVLLVFKRVVLGDELLGSKVGGLEVS